MPRVSGKTFTYIYRKGVAYFLHLTPAGNHPARYVMNRRSDKALSTLPPGYEIVENPNGRVSLQAIKPRLITTAEEALANERLSALGLADYCVEVKGVNLIIHEPHGPSEKDLALMDPPGSSSDEMVLIRKYAGKRAAEAATQAARRHWEEEKKRIHREWMWYDPMLRFRLSDKTDRLFTIARMCSRGVSMWLDLDELPLADALDRYLPHLGKDSFFDLI